MSGENALGIKIGGFAVAGYHSDNTPLSQTRGDLLAFNDVPYSVIFPQAYAYIERAG